MTQAFARTLGSAWGLLIAAAFTHAADVQVTKIGDSVVDAEALTVPGGFGRTGGARIRQCHTIKTI